MERTSSMIAKLTLGASLRSESDLSRPIRYLRHAAGVGFAITVLLLPRPAQGQGSFTNGSFATIPPFTTSFNITGPSVTPLVIPPWQTINDGIGCVVFPGTAPGNVCGSGRFAGTSFVADPGPLPVAGNYVLIDGSPSSGNYTNTTVLYQPVTGLTVGQKYTLTFWQAAAQFVAGSTGSSTTEQWLVSFDTDYTNCNPGPSGASFPTSNSVTSGPGFSCQNQLAPQMSTPGTASPPVDFQAWAKVTMTFLANAATELLGFFAGGTPGGAPPIALLGGISLDPVPSPFEVTYAANLNIGESYLDFCNTGANGAPLLGPGFGSASGNICLNVYTFDPGEELISCCSCLITPDQCVNLGVNRDLTVKTLTGVIPTSVTVKKLATLAGTGGTGTSCTNSAATVTSATLVSGIAAYRTTLHAQGTGYATTEVPFTEATLSPGELASIVGRCASILGNGSTFGVCSSCRAGTLGASPLPQ
jgi:hypothetical protein